MKTEHKAIHAEVKQIKESGEFEAVIATLGVIDHDGDIIESGAFNSGPVSIQPAHYRNSLPLGKAYIEERGDKAVAVGKINLETKAGKDFHSHLQFDINNPPSIQEWSFGFMTDESNMETRNGEDVRILKKMSVFEVSPVLLGAGIGTGTLAVKGRTLADELDSAINRVEEVRELRQAKGKDLGPERIAQLKEIKAKIETIVDDKKPTTDKEQTEEKNTDDIKPEERALAEDLARQVGDLTKR